ncbi:MAG: DUF3105 domain-containing protein [Candidatus Daviesbacteria bacterium]|nr:DUF3105 domain-containing protein [Candidatus Daviesbacteria bacterium]
MNNRIILIGIAVLAIGGFLVWLFMASNQPLPGEKIADLGREHITDISDFEYNSNPPTSGSHFPVWAKKGVYDRVLSDGYLIHSLEHGYVIISYNCDKEVVSSQSSVVIQAYAHEGESVEIHDVATDSAGIKPLTRMMVTANTATSFFMPDNPPPVEVELSENFQTEECKNLINQLSAFLDQFQRLIIVPRPSLDSRIALTAWVYIDKLNQFDGERIKKFIETHHNQGPEKTAE